MSGSEGESRGRATRSGGRARRQALEPERTCGEDAALGALGIVLRDSLPRARTALMPMSTSPRLPFTGRSTRIATLSPSLWSGLPMRVWAEPEGLRRRGRASAMRWNKEVSYVPSLDGSPLTVGPVL